MRWQGFRWQQSCNMPRGSHSSSQVSTTLWMASIWARIPARTSVPWQRFQSHFQDYQVPLQILATNDLVKKRLDFYKTYTWIIHTWTYFPPNKTNKFLSTPPNKKTKRRAFLLALSYFSHTLDWDQINWKSVKISLWTTGLRTAIIASSWQYCKSKSWSLCKHVHPWKLTAGT